MFANYSKNQMIYTDFIVISFSYNKMNTEMIHAKYPSMNVKRVLLVYWTYLNDFRRLRVRKRKGFNFFMTTRHIDSSFAKTWNYPITYTSRIFCRDQNLCGPERAAICFGVYIVISVLKVQLLLVNTGTRHIYLIKCLGFAAKRAHGSTKVDSRTFWVRLDLKDIKGIMQ